MLEKINGGVRLHIFAQPNGKKSEILGPYQDMLKVRLKAPPVEGKANSALIDFLAELTGLPRSKIILIRGELSRQKVVEIHGMTLEELQAKIGIEE